MKKVYFYIFNYISTFIICMLIEASLFAIFKMPDSVGDYFLFIFFGGGWIFAFHYRVCYCGTKIIEHGFIGKRIKFFSDIIAIEKLRGQFKTIVLIVNIDETKKRCYSWPIRIEYAFQKKQLIRMIEEIIKEKPDVKFINKGSLVSKETFFKKL